MRTILARFAVGAAFVVATAAAFRTPGRTTARFDKTTWDSVYTVDQATRGESLYKATCVKCHGPALAGGDDGSPLAGKEFTGGWNGMTLDQLYNKIYTTMPSETPKTLPAKDVADLIAFILSKNAMPAGGAVLNESVDQLKQIKFLSSAP
jgi:S-disulfanyl-L-cysteine oxidoreductase SoxD